MRKTVIFVLLFFIGLIVLYTFNPMKNFWMPKCPFKLLTGFSCPGCGFQRFVHALLHGRLGEAVSYNYWFIYAMPYGACFFIQRFFLSGEIKAKVRDIIEHPYAVWFYLISFTMWLFIRNYFNI